MRKPFRMFENGEFQELILSDQNVREEDLPEVDYEVLKLFAQQKLSATQTNLISRLIVRSKNWADAYEQVLSDQKT